MWSPKMFPISEGDSGDDAKMLFSELFITNEEKAMATHSSTLAWEIPWTEEPGGLQSTGSQRVRHN